MAHEWVFLSLLSAFGQALGWALKKKSLENTGLNNTLGCVAFFVAGVLLCVTYGVASGWAEPQLSSRFWGAAVIVICVNVTAAYMAYKALDIAPISLLMPFFPIVSLGTIPVEYVVRGVVLHAAQIVGIVMIVVGAILVSAKAMPDRVARKAVLLFFVSILCYSVGVPYWGVCVEEAHSGLFAATVLHLGIGLGFVPLIFVSKETRAIKLSYQRGEWRQSLLLMLAIGFIVAFLENGPQTIALLYVSASEAFALKRTMPFFALVLGVTMFREHITKRHIAGTALLVIGSIVVVWFK